ncbi:MAG: hypothetical protein JWO58_10 [Chitinophagaceae bacterium]|nr:hypothetical protein [Chitinophagaceae bacterium]
MKPFIIASVLFLATSFYAKAQTPGDSLDLADSDVDTVIIRDEPVVYTKSLVIEDVKTVKLYLSGYTSAFTTLDYYAPCEQCEDFLKQYKASVTSKRSYSYGLELAYIPQQKVLFALGADYSVIKEKFDYSSNGVSYTSNNSTNFIDARLTGGYWLGRNKKHVSLLVNAGVVYHRLIGAEGFINSFRDTNNVVVTIGDAEKLNSNQYSVTFSMKAILRPDKRIKVFIEPYYMGNIFSVTKEYYPYAQYYNRLGARLGMMFSI